MKRLKFGMIALFLGLILFVVPQSTTGLSEETLEPDVTILSYLVESPATSVLDALADKFEVHARMETGFEFYVPEPRKDEFLALAPKAQLLDSDVGSEVRGPEARVLAGYHTFSSMEQHLRKIASEHPDLASVEEYGKSKEGRSLFALQLASKSGTPSSAPAVLLTAATHGDELITVEVLMGLLDGLVDGYATDPRVAQIVNSHRIFFVPVINPDGYVRRQRYANGIDPNRDYPWPDMPDRNPNACIKAVMDFFAAKDIKASVDYHSSGGLFMYPWSYTKSAVHSEDRQKFQQITQKMAATNGYRHGQIPHLLYIAKGASADYYYWKNKTLAIAVEIGNSNVPPASSIPRYVKDHKEALWRFLEAVR